jgi:preprotein translocase subunit SecB
MKLSPLSLRSYYFTEVKISCNPSAKNEPQNYDIDVEVEPASVSPDKRQWCIMVTVNLRPIGDAIPTYSGQVQVIGSFAMDEAWPENDIEKMVYINGSGLLYAAIREMICGITSRGFFNMILLPSWSFGQMYADKEEAKRIAAETTQPKLNLEPPDAATTLPQSEPKQISSSSTAQ